MSHSVYVGLTLRGEDLAVHRPRQSDSKVANVNVLLDLTLALSQDLAHLERNLCACVPALEETAHDASQYAITYELAEVGLVLAKSFSDLAYDFTTVGRRELHVQQAASHMGARQQ
jgi:hypothetical protein